MISTAYLGALHVEGGQLQTLGLLLERWPKVKVNGPHPKVPPNISIYIYVLLIYILVERIPNTKL